MYKGKGILGVSGAFRVVNLDARGIKGTGKNGAIELHDLMEKDKRGNYIPKDSNRVVADKRFKNKFTKRGLSRMLHELLKGHPGGPYVPSDITYGQTRNPFQAFFVAADSPTTDGKLGDKKVLFNESDNQYNDRISSDNTTPGEGRRAVLLSDATGELKTISKEYRSTNPYGEAEFIFYAQPTTTYASSTGTINVVDGASLLDTDYFTIDDGFHNSLDFEFDSDGSWTERKRPVSYTGADTVDDVKDSIIAEINGSELYITASDGGVGVVNLTHDIPGTVHQRTITENVANVGFTVSGMSAGVANEAGNNKYIDNFPITGVGLAYGVNCGNGEADNQTGVRSIVGLAGTFQGISDRVYQHEAQAQGVDLDEYTYPDLVTTITNDGYVSNSKLAEVQVDSDISGDANDNINATTRIITFKRSNVIAALTTTYGFNKDAHLRKTLRISNSTDPNNNRDYTIEAILSEWMVKVFETPNSTVTENFMAAGDGVYTVYNASKMFDGRVENEGRTKGVDAGFGNGTTDNFSVAGNLVTLTIGGASWTSSIIGSFITITGFTKDDNDDGTISSGNNGTFLIEAVPSGTTLQYRNNYAVSELYGGGYNINDADEPGDVVLGEYFASTDGAGPHMCGRVWSAQKNLTGIRVVFPSGQNKIFCPDLFKIDVLTGTKPGDDSDWTEVADYSASSQSSNIYNGGAYGYEYTFSQIACYGVRLSAVTANDPSRGIKVSALMAFEQMSSVSFSGDTLRFATDGVPTYYDYDLPNMVATTDVNDIVDAINQAVRAYGVEAYRSTMGYLWFRATVAGKRSFIDLDNGAGINTKLGLTNDSKRGVTQEIRKSPHEALVIIYRIDLTGNVPGGWV